MIVGYRVIKVTYTPVFAPFSSNKMLNLEQTKDGRFNLKLVRDVRKTYSQMHCKDKYSHISLSIW